MSEVIDAIFVNKLTGKKPVRHLDLVKAALPNPLSQLVLTDGEDRFVCLRNVQTCVSQLPKSSR